MSPNSGMLQSKLTKTSQHNINISARNRFSSVQTVGSAQYQYFSKPEPVEMSPNSGMV